MEYRPRPKQLDSATLPKFIRLASRAHVWIYRATGGRIGGKFRLGPATVRGLPVMLLSTVGKKSGVKRTAPLLFIEEDGRVITVASQGGLPKHPLWYDNLTANPDVEVQIGGNVRKLRARTATPEERERLWPRLVAHYPGYGEYQTWTERTIPVVILEPTAL